MERSGWDGVNGRRNVVFRLVCEFWLAGAM